jgi:hypothetical protein
LLNSQRTEAAKSDFGDESMNTGITTFKKCIRKQLNTLSKLEGSAGIKELTWSKNIEI